MGVLVSYKCEKCGFFVDDIALGEGIAAFQEEVICKDCGSVVSRPTDENGKIVEKWNKCGKCGGSNLELWEKSCPKCGNSGLKMDVYGFWD